MDNVKDSYSLYLEIRCKNVFMNEKDKNRKAEELIACIYNELFGQWPYKVDHAAFIREVKVMLHTYDEGSQQMMEADRRQRGFANDTMPLISMADAYIIIMDLCEYIKSKGITNRGYRFQCCSFLFNGYSTLKSQQKDRVHVSESLKTLGEIVENMKKPETDAARTPQNVQNVAERWNILAYKKEQAKRAQFRMLENQEHVQAWHEEQALNRAKIAREEPSAGKLPENFVSSSNNIMENYVVQFAIKFIEVFNMISEGYAYHMKIAEASDNVNYSDAVLDYGELCLSIVDSLASFEVEEISTPPGERFNDKIHSVEGSTEASFSTKTAFVSESVRAGFKYKDIIIQKEKVKVSGGGGDR